jgi:hypothetical protein
VQGPNDITNVVLAYIPIGTPFSDADVILKRAGFHIPPPPTTHSKEGAPDRLNVVARIDSIDPEPYFPVRMYVDLTSEGCGDGVEVLVTIRGNFVVAALRKWASSQGQPVIIKQA